MQLRCSLRGRAVWRAVGGTGKTWKRRYTDPFVVVFIFTDTAKATGYIIMRNQVPTRRVSVGPVIEIKLYAYKRARVFDVWLVTTLYYCTALYTHHSLCVCYYEYTRTSFIKIETASERCTVFERVIYTGNRASVRYWIQFSGRARPAVVVGPTAFRPMTSIRRLRLLSLSVVTFRHILAPLIRLDRHLQQRQPRVRMNIFVINIRFYTCAYTPNFRPTTDTSRRHQASSSGQTFWPRWFMTMYDRLAPERRHLTRRCREKTLADCTGDHKRESNSRWPLGHRNVHFDPVRSWRPTRNVYILNKNVLQ